jgi:hypothetical protein
MWNVNGSKTSHVFLVKAQEAATARQVVIYDIENFSIDAPFQTRQNDGFGTIVHIAEWDLI